MKLLPTKYYAFGLFNAVIKIGFVVAVCATFIAAAGLFGWLWFFHPLITLLLVLLGVVIVATVKEAARAYANGMKISKPWEEKATNTGPK